MTTEDCGWGPNGLSKEKISRAETQRRSFILAQIEDPAKCKAFVSGGRKDATLKSLYLTPAHLASGIS